MSNNAFIQSFPKEEQFLISRDQQAKEESKAVMEDFKEVMKHHLNKIQYIPGKTRDLAELVKNFAEVINNSFFPYAKHFRTIITNDIKQKPDLSADRDNDEFMTEAESTANRIDYKTRVEATDIANYSSWPEFSDEESMAVLKPRMYRQLARSLDKYMFITLDYGSAVSDLKAYMPRAEFHQEANPKFTIQNLLQWQNSKILNAELSNIFKSQGQFEGPTRSPEDLIKRLNNLNDAYNELKRQQILNPYIFETAWILNRLHPTMQELGDDTARSKLLLAMNHSYKPKAITDNDELTDEFSIGHKELDITVLTNQVLSTFNSSERCFTPCISTIPMYSRGEFGTKRKPEHVEQQRLENKKFHANNKQSTTYNNAAQSTECKSCRIDHPDGKHAYLLDRDNKPTAIEKENWPDLKELIYERAYGEHKEIWGPLLKEESPARYNAKMNQIAKNKQRKSAQRGRGRRSNHYRGGGKRRGGRGGYTASN
ncbi:unnamed protein product [Ambrosiozyma monospora]|uniref:Unnamed protein product n=1 Tax=Ambrosiozyma monospora TaxID=43982 RepID=A0A9W6TB77_AMBMO|nr:unnamed protein product [Ambrosiozyma monospora]